MSHIHSYSRQQGMAMFTSLVILLLMTIIVLHAARSSTLEVFMGNNSQHTAQALMRAEDSVVAGEVLLDTTYQGAPTVDFSVVQSDGLYVDDEIDVNTVDWYGIASEQEGAGENLRDYIIEYLGSFAPTGGSLSVGAGAGSGRVFLYRVSGRGASSLGGTRVVQTIYAMAE
jgi:Tfp pilus assembly protein PilX